MKMGQIERAVAWMEKEVAEYKEMQRFFKVQNLQMGN